MALQQPAALGLGIGPGHRADGHPQAISEVAMGRQAIAGFQLAVLQTGGHGIGDGAVARAVAMGEIWGPTCHGDNVAIDR